MSWTWRLESADAVPMLSPASPAHANQSDAETWLGEHWRDLAEAGVAQATLLNGADVVYGPMSLSEE